MVDRIGIITRVSCAICIHFVSPCGVVWSCDSIGRERIGHTKSFVLYEVTFLIYSSSLPCNLYAPPLPSGRPTCSSVESFCASEQALSFGR